ncbi:cell division protein ZapA [bacterium]|nr:cell division protein ZapA [bacterium]
MQKVLKVTINGKQYSIATDEHDQDVIQAAQLVDSLISGKREKMPTLGDDKIALMVALHLATDLTKSQRVVAEGEAQLGQLVQLVDEVT